MPALNPYLASMPAGYLFREVAKRIDDYQRIHPEDKVISLGIGDVTRPLSAAVTRAMASAALEMGTKEGFRGYGPEGGYPFLIKAIYKNLYEPRGVTLSSDEIFVSDGAKSDTAALQQLLGGGVDLLAQLPKILRVLQDILHIAGAVAHPHGKQILGVCVQLPGHVDGKDAEYRQQQLHCHHQHHGCKNIVEHSSFRFIFQAQLAALLPAFKHRPRPLSVFFPGTQPSYCCSCARVA